MLVQDKVQVDMPSRHCLPVAAAPLRSQYRVESVQEETKDHEERALTSHVFSMCVLFDFCVIYLFSYLLLERGTYYSLNY